MRSPSAARILEVSLYAEDLDAAERFYVETLGLEVSSRFGDALAFRCADQVLLVFDPLRSSSADRSVPPHGAEGAGHVAFAVDEEDLPAWREHLLARGVEIEEEVVWDAGMSLYFRDPAGNLIELAPPGLWR